MKLRISRNQQRAVIDGHYCVFVPYRDQYTYEPRANPSDKTACDRCVLQDRDAAANGADLCLVGERVRIPETCCAPYHRKDHKAGYWKEVKE